MIQREFRKSFVFDFLSSSNNNSARRQAERHELLAIVMVFSRLHVVDCVVVVRERVREEEEKTIEVSLT